MACANFIHDVSLESIRENVLLKIEKEESAHENGESFVTAPGRRLTVLVYRFSATRSVQTLDGFQSGRDCSPEGTHSTVHCSSWIT